jgi:hypothetical protein
MYSWADRNIDLQLMSGPSAFGLLAPQRLSELHPESLIPRCFQVQRQEENSTKSLE